MLIGGFQKSSLIDYPEKIAAIVFTQGCNFRCPYCHNPELIQFSENFDKQAINEDDLFDFLKNRKGKLDAVVVTGGEPTLQKDLADFLFKIKSLDFDVKLDTNGTNPNMLKSLLDKNLIDYVAMDIKAPLEKYNQIVCRNIDVKSIEKSINILKTSNIKYEFRTTVVKSQLSFDDFEKIGQLIKGSDKYYLQKFLPTKTLNKEFMGETTYSDEEFIEISSLLQKYIKFVEIR